MSRLDATVSVEDGYLFYHGDIFYAFEICMGKYSEIPPHSRLHHKDEIGEIEISPKHIRLIVWGHHASAYLPNVPQIYDTIQSLYT